jgi:hypothetical protein
MLTEHKILICAANVNPDQNRLKKIQDYLSMGIDMDRLIALAQKEGLAGFLYRSLSKARLLETLSPRHRQKLHRTYHLTVHRNLKLAEGLGTILESLNYDGIPVVLVQGISLMQSVYQDIGLRPLKDMDLWVLPNDYQNLVMTLVGQGFERDLNYPSTLRKDQVILDIQTHILQVGQVGDGHNLPQKSPEEIFFDTVSIDFEGRHALILSPQDQFLHLGLHAIRRNMKRLLWLVDINNLIVDWKATDWQALKHRAEELGHQRTLVYTLYMLTHIFKPALPSGILFYLEMERPNFLEKRILDRRVTGQSIPSWARLILISAGRGFGDRISFFMKTLFSKLAKLSKVIINNLRQRAQRLYWKRILRLLGVRKVS